MSDIVDTSPLGIERTERIAGDAALNSRLDTVTTELQGTQESVTTEVLHRSEGDLVIQRILEGYIQDLLEGKAEDFERYIEFQNSQNLNYADVRNFVSSIRTSLADDIRDLSTNLLDNLQANDARYNKLVSDVDRYLEILSDITLDSNQITLDNGELRAGAWTILSQARAWDLEIISRLNGLSESVGDSLKDAVEDIQNQLPSTEETITKAIEELSKSPLIRELSDLLNQSIENDIAYELALLEQARKHANEMSQLAEDMRAEALAKAQEMEDYMAGEVTARITEVNKEVAARKEAIDLLTEDMLTRVDQDKADYQADMLAVTNRIKSAEDGLTSEIQHRKDGDSSTLNALNTYKVSNDSAITGLSTSLSNNVTKTSANTTLITGLAARMTTAEEGIDRATTAAADAMSKATTAVSANSALATRVDALAASITEIEGTVVDVNAFNALKAEVNTVKGTVTGLVEDVTALESNYTSVNNKVTSQGTAISTLNTKMSTAENSIRQSANDITLLKTDISKVNAGLLTKVDSQAFSQLSSDVSDLDGKYTTQAGLVTDLRGSLDTTNVNVGNAASAAQNALNTAGSKGKVIFGTTAPAVADRLSQNLWIDTTGGANTPKRWNGSAWVVVTDKVATDALAAANAATNLANTKADTSAFNSLDQKVTVMDGKVSTNTNSITSLNGKIAIVEGAIATKLDSSAIANYYTKQQADDKALSTAAGEISKYDASLVIGGVNLLPNSDFVRGYLPAITSNVVSHYTNKAVASTPIIRAVGTVDGVNLGIIQPVAYRTMKIEEGKQYTISLLVSSSFGALTYLYLMHPSSVANQAIPYSGAVSTDPNAPTRVSITFTANSSSSEAYIMVANRVQSKGAWLEFAELQLEEGTKATSWSPATEDTQASLDANATAITNINAEVTRVDDLVTATNTDITALKGSLATTNSAVTLKADQSAVTALTGRVAETESGLTSTNSNITSLKSAIAGTAESITANGSQATLDVIGQPVANAYLSTNSDSMTGNVVKLKGAVSTHLTNTKLLIDPTKLYKLRMRYRRTAGTNNPIYIAVINYNAAGNQTVTATNGLNPVGTQISNAIYPIAYELPALNVWRAVDYYFKGKSTGTSTGTGTLADPRKFPALAATVDIGVLANYSKGNDLTQEYEIDYLIFEDATNEAANNANASAITVTNTEVARVDDRVTTESNRITTLTGRVSLVEGAVTTKADVSALNALTTRVDTVEGGLSTQANNTTKLEAKIDSRSSEFSLAHDYDTKNPDEWESHYSDRDLNVHFKTITGGKIGNNVFRKDTTHPSTNFNYNLSDVPNDRAYRLSMWVRCSADATGSVGFNYKYTTDASPEFTSLYSTVGNVAITKNGTWQLVTAIADLRTSAFNRLRFGFYMGHTGAAGWWEMQGFKVEAVFNADDADDTLATTTALNSTNTEVSRINGVVEGHSTDLTNLTASIAGKADAGALSALTVRVTEEERKSTSQASDITSLTSTANNALDSVTIKDTRSTNQPPSWYWANYPRRTVNEFKSQTAIGVSGFFGGTYCNLETRVYYPDSSGGGIIQTATSSNDTSAYVQRTSSGSSTSATWTAWSQPIKDIRDELGTKASASALSTLDTKVEKVDGIVSTHASQLIVLTSDNNANKNALTVQGKVIDGVKSSYMVKMETNGVIGGFGLMQSTGALGQVQTSFGVNANSFFIGAPASKKQPFIVTTTNQVVNGVTYPAGTYIDVALIANATIGTAKIADLSVTAAKIANATITGAKIANATIGTAQIANLAVTAAKIANATITSAEIANAAITTAKIGKAQVDTLQIAGEAVTVPVSILSEAEFTANYTPFSTVPYTFEGNLKYWEDSFGTIATITLNRSGGKVRFDATLSYVDHNAVIFWGQEGQASLTSAETYTARAVLSIYRGTTLVGRAEIAPNGAESINKPLFTGTYVMVGVIDDTNITGNVTYTLKFGLSHRLGRNGRIVWGATNGYFKVRSPRIIATEMKR